MMYGMYGYNYRVMKHIRISKYFINKLLLITINMLRIDKNSRYTK